MTRSFAILCSLIAAGSIGFPNLGRPDEGENHLAPMVEVFKSPNCGCCTAWADHLEANGFRTQVTEVMDLDAVKRRGGVPEDTPTCHTGFVEGYVIEGHVPASDIRRLLDERPPVRGLVVPGMPLGSPGMESPTHQPYTVYTFDEAGRKSFFSSH